MSNNIAGANERANKSRSKPSMELYKPPVLRGLGQQLHEKSFINPHTVLLSDVEQDSITSYPRHPPACPTDSEGTLVEIESAHEFSCSNDRIPVLMQTIDEIPEFEEIVTRLGNLINTDSREIGDFLARHAVPFYAQHIGEYLVKHAIEDSGEHKQIKRSIVAQAFISLANTSDGIVFCHGVVRALERYFHCRGELRHNLEYFPIWLNFVRVTCEFGQIAQEDNVVRLVFSTLKYLFNRTVVNSLQIAELECSLSTLIIAGYRLEQEYPAQMSELKALIRDAFLFATEAWIRKMLMLFVELGAAGWKLLPELEEYYFR